MTPAHHLTAHWEVEDDATPGTAAHHHVVEHWVTEDDAALTSTAEGSEKELSA